VEKERAARSATMKEREVRVKEEKERVAKERVEKEREERNPRAAKEERVSSFWQRVNAVGFELDTVR